MAPRNSLWVPILSYMRNKNALEKIEYLLEKPSFTSKDAIQYGVTAATLAYYAKIGEITRIGHGLYRKSDKPVADDYRWEDLVEATHVVRKGVVCLISALAIYDITEEIPRQHWIAVNHKTRHRAHGAIKIVRMRNFEIGQRQLAIGNSIIPIYDMERTIIDTFRYLSKEIGIKALRMAMRKNGNEKLDIKKINLYSAALKVKIDPFILAETTV